MGQKVHPTGFRLGITTQHTSNWYAEKSQYTENLLKDIEVREHLSKKLAHASVSRIDIERTADNARVLIHTARPGIVIGKKGCLLYTSPSPRDRSVSRMPSSA